jgi:FAD/FMN-containing dehydrogenase
MSTTNPANALRKEFSGQVLEPGQPGYDESRRLFNPMIDRHPAVVARCATTADVVAAVNTARERQFVVAVRCGGHSFSGLSACDDPLSQMIIFRIGQGVAAVPDEATAFSHRDASYLFHPITAWADPADDERMIAATRAFAAAMRPFSTGAAYLNFTPEADRVLDAYGDDKYARLVALKDTYDPANLFRLNQNIQPSQPAAEPPFA